MSAPQSNPEAIKKEIQDILQNAKSMKPMLEELQTYAGMKEKHADNFSASQAGRIDHFFDELIRIIESKRSEVKNIYTNAAGMANAGFNKLKVDIRDQVKEIDDKVKQIEAQLKAHSRDKKYDVIKEKHQEDLKTLFEFCSDDNYCKFYDKLSVLRITEVTLLFESISLVDALKNLYSFQTRTSNVEWEPKLLARRQKLLVIDEDSQKIEDFLNGMPEIKNSNYLTLDVPLPKEENKDGKKKSKETTDSKKDVVHAQIWSSKGFGNPEELSEAFYQEVDAAFLIYDPAEEDSLDKIGKWIEYSRNHCPNRTLYSLITLERENATIDEEKLTKFEKEHSLFGNYTVPLKLNREGLLEVIRDSVSSQASVMDEFVRVFKTEQTKADPKAPSKGGCTIF